MSKRRFRFSNSSIKNRLKRDKPLWMWKWTKNAWHKYEQKRKDGEL